MKKIVLFLFITTFASLHLTAKDRYYTEPFEWDNPEILAQGGSFMANGQGFGSLLVNPASFEKSTEKVRKDGSTKKKGEVTILSIDASYSGDIFTYMEEDRNTDKELIELILDQATSNGLGTYFAAGGGYVGRRFGFGVISTAGAEAPPVETTLGITANFNWTTGLVAGYAHPFDVGPFKIVVGGDLRPMYRVSIQDVDIASLTNSVAGEEEESGNFNMTNIDAFGGMAVAVDLGADLYWKDLIGSLTMRDIGNTRFFYEPLDTAAGLEFSGNESENIYIIPWSLGVGVAYNPQFGRINKFVDPTVHAAFTQPLIQEDSIYEYKEQSFWTRLDMGLEVVVLSSVALRTGLQGGYFTAGFGLDLFFLELNGALYAKETGAHAGDQPKMGGSLEFAVRF